MFQLAQSPKKMAAKPLPTQAAKLLRTKPLFNPLLRTKSPYRKKPKTPNYLKYHPRHLFIVNILDNFNVKCLKEWQAILKKERRNNSGKDRIKKGLETTIRDLRESFDKSPVEQGPYRYDHCRFYNITRSTIEALSMKKREVWKVVFQAESIDSEKLMDAVRKAGLLEWKGPYGEWGEIIVAEGKDGSGEEIIGVAKGSKDYSTKAVTSVTEKQKDRSCDEVTGQEQGKDSSDKAEVVLVSGSGKGSGSEKGSGKDSDSGKGSGKDSGSGKGSDSGKGSGSGKDMVEEHQDDSVGVTDDQPCFVGKKKKRDVSVKVPAARKKAKNQHSSHSSDEEEQSSDEESVGVPTGEFIYQKMNDYQFAVQAIKKISRHELPRMTIAEIGASILTTYRKVSECIMCLSKPSSVQLLTTFLCFQHHLNLNRMTTNTMSVEQSSDESCLTDDADNIEMLDYLGQKELATIGWKKGLEIREASQLFASIFKERPNFVNCEQKAMKQFAVVEKRFLKYIFQLLVYLVYCKTNGKARSHLQPIFSESSPKLKVLKLMEKEFQEIEAHATLMDEYTSIAKKIYRKMKTTKMNKLFHSGEYLCKIELKKLVSQLRSQLKNKLGQNATFTIKEYVSNANPNKGGMLDEHKNILIRLNCYVFIIQKKRKNDNV